MPHPPSRALLGGNSGAGRQASESATCLAVPAALSPTPCRTCGHCRQERLGAAQVQASSSQLPQPLVPMMPGREMPSLQMPDKWLAPRVHRGPPTQLKHGCRLQQLPGTVAVPLQLHTPHHHTRDDLFHSKARM